MKKRITVLLVMFFFMSGTTFAASTINNVTIEYDDASQAIEIGYDLSGDKAIITLQVMTNGVAIPNHYVTRLTGDVCRLIEPGANKKMTWYVKHDWPEIKGNIQAKLKVWPEDEPPLYMVLDLTKPGDTAIPIYYYLSEDALPYGGITNSIYKTFLLAMRRIDPGSFFMGSPGTEVSRTPSRETLRQVTITKAYYIAVYELTHRQYNHIRNAGSPGGQYNGPLWIDTRPVGKLSYYHIREQWSNAPMAIQWPESFDVGSNSLMGMLSARTGMDFDLPTSSQWEYACRAGTDTALNFDGGYNITNGNSDAMMDLAGRYQYNGGRVSITGVWYAAEAAYEGDLNRVPPSNASAEVGSYPPNAWGLYDMHGNLYEHVLNWEYPNETAILEENQTDPKGFPYPPNVNSNRMLRSGSYINNASMCRSAAWSYASANNTDAYFGVRIVRRLGRW